MQDAGVTQHSPALFTSVKQSWCTPASVWQRVLKIAPIGLDPCTNRESEVPARVYFMEQDDAFTQYWGGMGLVYCNPPYEKRFKYAWLEKGVEADEIVYLLPSRTDTKWFQDLHKFDLTVCCFVKGRLRFSGAKDLAPFPSVLLYGGSRPERFAEVFSDFGRVCWLDQVHERRL